MEEQIFNLINLLDNKQYDEAKKQAQIIGLQTKDKDMQLACVYIVMLIKNKNYKRLQQIVKKF